MKREFEHIKVIGFDADDTLWVNETYFRDAELEFARLLASYETANKIDQELFKMEMKNLELYGYGVKGFVLSMVEMALELSDHTISVETIGKILDIGKAMLNKPVELLDGVEDTLKELSQTHRLILVTKGDLLDQERKLEKSNLTSYFHHIEVLSDKQTTNYMGLLSHLDIEPSEFLMVGNSLKSDILPIIEIGAKAIHVPFHTTWLHEQVSDQQKKDKEYKTISSLNELRGVLG
ncbi:HAD family hydrolase [Psychroserpens sp.]|uniref:HAD family hydrolase n=1 Tax=Psychroserpens sp. TaxID=2020870 RepID=UPI001B1AC582|nr:HAD family hydrolase [Psychroserpens sp.]MBO6606297.1 HAD hydrolase-like protein [Psychroserpens sp.]MBO6653001.1 HAD hydrolase-like protein [Psychroserpens sp.]MBO6680972.1 HAD hydrolase-like protein [Psychroserpens sp.]MBO6750072.1 HAD hydrolase-like protein [Psychroserpens sp.]MBO6914552.1 HAD hydrolase-like protein [Psychroserpens sp.]